MATMVLILISMAAAMALMLALAARQKAKAYRALYREEVALDGIALMKQRQQKRQPRLAQPRLRSAATVRRRTERPSASHAVIRV